MSSKKSKRKKILIIARALDLQSAGIHVYAKNLILYLDKFGDHQAFEYCVIRADDKINFSFENISQVVFKNKFKLPLYNSFSLFFIVPSYARKNNFDMVVELAHFGPFNLPKSIKRATVIHDLTPVLFSEFHAFTSSFLQKLFLPRILHKANLIISNSQNTQKDILKTYPTISAKTSVIYLGVNGTFKPVSERDVSLLSKYGIDNKYILYLGTIEPRKNLVTLLKAYAQFREKTGEKILLIIGGKNGWKNEAFYKELKASIYQDEIKLIGFVENQDLNALYGNCEVFVYPSIYEGFGLPVVEALSSGAQVICAKNSSLIEFGNDLVSYFETFSPDSLAKKLFEVIVGKQKKEIDLKKLKEKYNWKTHVEKFEKSLLDC